MPSKTKKQAKLMAAVAHNPKFAKKVGIPQSVGREFNDADQKLHKYADGGKVLPSSQDEEEPWSDTYIKRPLSGLASLWGGTDPDTGEFVSPAWHNLKRVWNADERRRQGLPPEEMATLGIVDETISLPALGQLIGLPVPEFATDAEDRASSTREAARSAIGVDAPHGFAENIAESAGVMAGQMPVPAAWANRLKLLKESGKLGKAGKILGPAAEWFSPTVVPKAKNYLQGTLFGGLLGGSLDYMEDKEAEDRHRQFISEAVAEVLEEERLKRAAESGDEASDDEALAELGYAEGGKVSIAQRSLAALRKSLDEADDPVVRQAKIDEALRAINTPGTVELPKTIRAGLNEQREPAGISALVDKAIPLLQPARQSDVDIKDIVSNIPPPARVLSAEDSARSTAHGTMADDVLERLMRRVGYHDRGANPLLSDEMLRLDQEDLDWEKMHGYAEGGQVGAPLSQSWYETYGQGPEHLFLGDRRVSLPEGWGPVHPNIPKPPGGGGSSSSTFDNLAGLATLGLIGWDAYKDLTDNPGASGGVSGLDNPTVDTASTEAHNQQNFDNLEMPTAEFDPSVWDRTKQGAGGALDLYIGSQQGGAEGAGNMISGAGDLYEAFGGKNQFSNIAGNVGGILQGVGDGTVQGYLQAGGDAAQLAQAMGYTGPVLDSAGQLLPIVGQLFSAYEGIKRGDPAGYAQAAGSAYGAASAAGLTSSTGALATSGLSTAAPLAAAGFAIADLANAALGVGKKGAALESFLESLGGRRATVKEARNSPGGIKAGYYVLPDGRLISNKELKNMYKEAGSPYGGL